MTSLTRISLLFWALLSRTHKTTVEGTSTSTSLSSTAGTVSPRQSSPPPLAVWGYCGSHYSLADADAIQALDCATSLSNSPDDSITVSRSDDPSLLCEREDAKIWIIPFLNKPDGPSQDSFSFQTADVRNLTLQGLRSCCHGTSCSGWGMLSMVPGRDDVVVSVNGADRPEPVPWNSVGVKFRA
ncbi:hypothetical protein F5Y17DRAFT_458588 [Xylariaceae sp. FL0594]|nr:hypothetical protein F5Y17DRAFT_458588 [Xylariaceae sp. FL0594]